MKMFSFHSLPHSYSEPIEIEAEKLFGSTGEMIGIQLLKTCTRTSIPTAYCQGPSRQMFSQEGEKIIKPYWCFYVADTIEEIAELFIEKMKKRREGPTKEAKEYSANIVKWRNAQKTGVIPDEKNVQDCLRKMQSGIMAKNKKW